MKIELLYPEVTNLYGEGGDQLLLSQLPGATILKTALNEAPRFLTETIDLVFIGASSEHNQQKMLLRLMPYKEAIRAKIEAGQKMICTGNGLELFVEAIETPNQERIAALGVFPFVAKQDFKHRHNSLFHGQDKDGLDIIGFKTQFTYLYGESETYRLFQTIRGCGLNPDTQDEGIYYKNFYGTYLVGPFLVMNPLFVEKVLQVSVPFKADMLAAYENRLAEFQLDQTHHDG